MKTIFAFDVGLASLGLAARKGDDIVHADSLLIDPNVATIDKEAGRRRQYRTRQTHKQRELWWEQVWENIGRNPLRGIRYSADKQEWTRGDPRLEREFPPKGDDTVYTSCLLRIQLLEGKPLQDWQIYKAIRSAFQRAGYAEVPWERKQQRGSPEINADNKKSDDDKESQKRVSQFIYELETLFPNQAHHYPCYYDAWKMGLFDPQRGSITSIRQNHCAKRTRGKYTASRKQVEKELRLLLTQAAVQIPELREKIAIRLENPEHWQNYILFGSTAESIKHGRMGFDDTKIEGILDQKLARFDNRCVEECCAIPNSKGSRFKAIRAANILYYQTEFLLRLRNMWVERGGNKTKLSTEEIREWYEQCDEERKKKIHDWKASNSPVDIIKLANTYKITKSKWKKWCERKEYTVYPATAEIKSPKTTGRCRFSRPALILLRELILSGKRPHDFRQELVESNFRDFSGMGLQPQHLDFLLRMKENDPEAIYIVPPSLVKRFIESDGDVEKACFRIIGSTRHTVVRHRLSVFFRELQKLMKEYGTPDAIVIEFAREDFTPAWKKKKYEKASKDNQKIYEEACKQLRDGYGDHFADPSDKLVLKFMLWKKQEHKCIYTGAQIEFSDLKACDIDHIIPQKGKYNGPDAIENKVLTHHRTNKEKGARLPRECPEIIKDEEAYKQRVEQSKFSRKTKNILLCINKEESDALIDRYYGLATTGLVARLARDIACTWLGWEPGAEGEKRRLHVVSGSLVAKIRTTYHINKALIPVEAAAHTFEKVNDGNDEASDEGKNRGDSRHHALDAMVMTYLEEYMRNTRNFDALKLPEGRNNPQYFANKLEELKVVPHKIARAKATIGETAYRGIEEGGKLVQLVHRVSIYSLKDVKKIINPEHQRFVEKFLKEYPKPTQKEALQIWQDKARKYFDELRLQKVTVYDGSPENAIPLYSAPFARPGYYVSTSRGSAGTTQHGYFLYRKGDDKWRVKPVYAFESPYHEKEKLIRQGYIVKDDVLFYSGCVIEITSPIEKKDIDTGFYRVKTIKSIGAIELENLRGNEFGLALSKLKNDFRFIK